jgi:OFA family oxalate/formate antiporter-like MFS transporter
MLCIGGIYAWSIIASELIKHYGFSTSDSQMIFGTLIATFPTAMIFVGKISKKMKFKYLGLISGILFFSGYYMASLSKGNFISILFGVGIIGGIATGFGYWVSLTSPVLLFPKRKGLITGISAAGFGLGAVLMTRVSNEILGNGKNILQLLSFIGVVYGFLIVMSSFFIYQKEEVNNDSTKNNVKTSILIRTKLFKKLFLGLFLGAFAGLLIIGNLKIIGIQAQIPTNFLSLGITFFAISNFLGRLIWGFISDFIGASFSIFLALLFQSLAIISLNLFPLTSISFLIISFFIGFGFGGNFVLFAKETAQEFGVANLGLIYPYIFLGYGIAGICGPFIGGVLFDILGNYSYSIYIAAMMSLGGSLLSLKQYVIANIKANMSISG